MNQSPSPLIGIYPGTFDPLTQGHMDIIERAATLVDQLIIGVATNPYKAPLFDLEERVHMVAEEIQSFTQRKKPHAHIHVKPFDCLLLKFAHQENAKVIIRGLRAVSDFEYEFQMAGMNLRMDSSIETIFLMASDRFQFISSSMVKEVGRLKGDISSFVPPGVAHAIEHKFR
jgi:pantetheine-phosphate adenylyltransferase